MSDVSPADPFETSEFSIAWAKHHIAELDREITALMSDDDASTVFVEKSSNAIWQMIKFKLTKPMPFFLRGHASDAPINLRHALDQAICAVHALCSLPTHSTYFPIGRNVTEFQSALNGRCGKLPQEIREIISRSKPYKGGNDLLWALNVLANTNKHGILRPVMFSNVVHKMEGFGMGTYIFSPPRWDSDKEELILAKIPAGHKFELDYDLSFFVAFNEIEFIAGQEVLAVLCEFVDVVEGIVMAIKAESKRIGLWS